jgi:hypothetical protein
MKSLFLLIALCASQLALADPPVEIRIASFKDSSGVKMGAALDLTAEELTTQLASYLDGGVLLDPVVKSGVYKKKTFYYLTASLVRPNAEPNQIAFMLTKSGDNLMFSPETSCVMECRRTEKSDCAFCNLEIKKPCQKIKCPCEKGKDGFEPSIRRLK